MEGECQRSSYSDTLPVVRRPNLLHILLLHLSTKFVIAPMIDCLLVRKTNCNGKKKTGNLKIRTGNFNLANALFNARPICRGFGGYHLLPPTKDEPAGPKVLVYLEVPCKTFDIDSTNQYYF